MDAENTVIKCPPFNPNRSRFTAEQLRFFNENGFLLIPRFFGKKDVGRMIAWVEEIEKWPSSKGKHLNYFELINDVPVLSRTENFLPFHSDFRSLIESSGIFEMMREIFGEPPILFKEKINYKFPNTGEYPPHQDVHAYDTSPYAFQPYHRNVAIFLDSTDEDNGCMELGWGSQKNTVLPHEPTGKLLDEVVSSLEWRPVPCPPGSIFIFDMYWPHRSGPNTSSRARRTVFLTFNGESKGNLRSAHYKDRESGTPKTREIKPGLVVETLLENRVKHGN